MLTSRRKIGSPSLSNRPVSAVPDMKTAARRGNNANARRSAGTALTRNAPAIQDVLMTSSFDTLAAVEVIENADPKLAKVIASQMQAAAAGEPVMRPELETATLKTDLLERIADCPKTALPGALSA